MRNQSNPGQQGKGAKHLPDFSKYYDWYKYKSASAWSLGVTAHGRVQD